MQDCGKLSIKIIKESFLEFKNIFETFRLQSMVDYKFETPPLSFEDAATLIENETLKGYVLYEDEKPAGFLLYFVSDLQAIEVNIIHIEGKNFINKKRKELLARLVEDVKGQDFWNVISYPLLGIQQSFMREIVQVGFKMVGQTIVKFPFDSPLSDKIRKKVNLADLPEDYELTEWKPEYFEQACDVIFESFSKAKDTLFDPRFLTLEGTRDVLTKITTEEYGVFLNKLPGLYYKKVMLEEFVLQILQIL